MEGKDRQTDAGLGMVCAALPACGMAPGLQKLLESQIPPAVSLQDSGSRVDKLHSLHRFLCPLLALLLQHRWVLPARAPFPGEMLCREVGAGLGQGPRYRSHPAVLASGARPGAAAGMLWAASRATRALGNTKGQRLSSGNTRDRFLASERLQTVSWQRQDSLPESYSTSKTCGELEGAGRVGASRCPTPPCALGGLGQPWGAPV